MGEIGRGLLGTISPAYGAATGEGLFGKMTTSLFGKKKDKEGDQPNGKVAAAPQAGPMPEDLSPLPTPSNNSDPDYLNNLLKNLGVYGNNNARNSNPSY